MKARPEAAVACCKIVIIPTTEHERAASAGRCGQDGWTRRRRGGRGRRGKVCSFSSCHGVILLSLGLGFGTIGSSQAATGYYTTAQATAGQAVFDQTCSICHGEHLEGKAGPALAGEQFLSVSQFQNLTAEFLYKFMSKQMPANAPGSLSKTQYLDVLAYILEVNGYPAGSRQLTADDQTLNQIKIEPTGKSQGGNGAKEATQ
jgi:S-disulfanyl-L-cysteine oxidoreductase SoxD